MDIKHLYIEPTSHCNLQCEMCSRNHWQNEAIAHMDTALFNKLMDEIPPSVERIFFGGIGEPLTHPDILHMVARAAQTGRRVEMITNGTLLTEETSQALVAAGLKMLWVSLDSLDEASYAAIRKGGALGGVMANIRSYNTVRKSNIGPHRTGVNRPLPLSYLGIAFVLMKKNLPDFQRLVSQAEALEIDEIRATHLLPYDAEQEKEVLYRKMLDTRLYREKTPYLINVDLPLMAPADIEALGVLQVFSNSNTTLSIMNEQVARKANHCRFIDDAYVFVRWDGTVCPCMALLHDNQVYQHGRARQIRHSGYGNIANASLQQIWDGEEYTAFRHRVEHFAFSPCVSCGACDMYDTNAEDCFGNLFPTCGGCLWSEGLFQCP
ncbi:MAG: radical SAM protein [Ruminococcaceae bacterium]|nr:radical SAM protein [Oscillospiraceae bacterium]